MFLQLDLGSLKSVRKAAEEFLRFVDDDFICHSIMASMTHSQQGTKARCFVQ